VIDLIRGRINFDNMKFIEMERLVVTEKCY